EERKKREKQRNEERRLLEERRKREEETRRIQEETRRIIEARLAKTSSKSHSRYTGASGTRVSSKHIRVSHEEGLEGEFSDQETPKLLYKSLASISPLPISSIQSPTSPSSFILLSSSSLFFPATPAFSSSTLHLSLKACTDVCVRVSTINRSFSNLMRLVDESPSGYVDPSSGSQHSPAFSSLYILNEIDDHSKASTKKSSVVSFRERDELRSMFSSTSFFSACPPSSFTIKQGREHTIELSFQPSMLDRRSKRYEVPLVGICGRVLFGIGRVSLRPPVHARHSREYPDFHSPPLHSSSSSPYSSIYSSDQDKGKERWAWEIPLKNRGTSAGFFIIEPTSSNSSFTFNTSIEPSSGVLGPGKSCLVTVSTSSLSSFSSASSITYKRPFYVNIIHGEELERKLILAGEDEDKEKGIRSGSIVSKTLQEVGKGFRTVKSLKTTKLELKWE
ncbi:hypothetical protein ADUPG1_000362, partial [Aduncisulcus paluster]